MFFNFWRISAYFRRLLLFSPLSVERGAKSKVILSHAFSIFQWRFLFENCQIDFLCYVNKEVMEWNNLFRELLHYQRPKDNPFRLVFAGLVMFSILFGLYQSSIIDFKLWLVRYFYFLYYQPLPLKQLMTRLSVVGSYLLGNLLGMLSTHIAWLIPIVVALVGFVAAFSLKSTIFQNQGPSLV